MNGTYKSYEPYKSYSGQSERFSGGNNSPRAVTPGSSARRELACALRILGLYV